MKSKKRSFVIYILLILVYPSLAQVTFQKTYGGSQDDEFNYVQQTFDGGYILVGETRSFGAGGYDIYLVKTDSIGDIVWTKTYGGTEDDFGYEVQQNPDSGYIVIGSTHGNAQGNQYAYLIKTNIVGDTLWEKTFKPGTSGGAYSFKQTFDGGFILDCNYDGVAGLVKTNAQGDTLWTKTYGISGFSYEVQQTADSGYIMVGIGDDPVSSYEYLIKTDVDGNTVWKKAYKGSSFNNDHSGFSVQQTSDGGYITIGCINRPVQDLYLVKTNSFGDTLWTKAFAADSVNIGFSIFITADSGFIIAGATSRFGAGIADVYLIKTDSVGNILWSKTFGSINFDEALCVRQSTDGGYILAGKTNSYGAGSNDAYLIKTGANGNSGCYENTVVTNLKVPATIVALPADSLPSTPTLVNSFSAIVGSGGIIYTLCTTAEINELIEVNEISIYPNPAQNNFTININVVVSNANFEIHNMFGEEIYSATLNHKQLTVNCTSFPSGIYFISVRMGSQLIKEKLIVSK